MSVSDNEFLCVLINEYELYFSVILEHLNAFVRCACVRSSQVVCL